MKNVKRYHDNVAFILTSVTRDRTPVFSRGKAAALLEAIFIYYHQVMRFAMYGYVIMPDHFHLICRPSSRYNISEIMNAIKGDFARQFNILRRRVGEKIWQKKFHDHGIRSEHELIKKIEYVHNNPVNAGLVVSPNDWIFSSSKWYESNQTKIKIIDSF